MTIREIDERLLSLVDPETGEIQDVAAFQALQMERGKKVENMALWVLDLKDEAQAVQHEIERLQERKAAIEAKAKRLRQYIQIVSNGEKVKTPLVSVHYLQTESVKIDDAAEVVRWAQAADLDGEVLRYAEPEINRQALKKRLKAGETVPGAELVAQTSTVIK